MASILPRTLMLARDARGQMTVELAAVFPVVLIIAVIAVNACTFFSECAEFDRVSRNAIRTVATSPAYEQTAAESVDRIKAAIESQMGSVCSDCRVVVEQSGEHSKYTATMQYSPTLFGMGLQQSVFGIGLPKLSHATTLVISTYKPGMLL
ncbi:hypothetical protein [Adlercreutzia sp. ZJ304]|uniref:TadE/TadG family type IV pilus assembly protein n=1 Tax=Adlercreutzia sp. ZJ304 TaxID=2709791 RepID=UPI001F14ABBF|nr:hypothetical protein [Adlercreutzia sp. ZJ304]